MFLSRVISLHTGVTIIMAVFALPVINAQSPPCETGQVLQNTLITCEKAFGIGEPITCVPETVPGDVIEVVGTRFGCNINPDLSVNFLFPLLEQDCIGTVVSCVTPDPGDGGTPNALLLQLIPLLQALGGLGGGNGESAESGQVGGNGGLLGFLAGAANGNGGSRSR